KAAVDQLGRNRTQPRRNQAGRGGYGLRRNPSKRFGGAEGARTPDPKTASLVLSQLSYSPTRSEDYRPCDWLSRKGRHLQAILVSLRAPSRTQIDRSPLLV